MVLEVKTSIVHTRNAALMQSRLCAVCVNRPRHPHKLFTLSYLLRLRLTRQISVYSWAETTALSSTGATLAACQTLHKGNARPSGCGGGLHLRPRDSRRDCQLLYLA